MNKQELIKKINEIATETPFPDAKIVDHSEIIKLIEQLDEPQKPVVPQFVADWYEENKDDFETNLFNTIGLVIRDFEDGDLSAFEEWILDKHKAPFQTLVNMHQFGYEVEKEKRYLVKMKGIEGHNSYLKYNKNLTHWYFGSLFIYNNDVDTRTYHTRKELEEAGFGEVFTSPLFEVEEVEE